MLPLMNVRDAEPPNDAECPNLESPNEPDELNILATVLTVALSEGAIGKNVVDQMNKAIAR